MIVYEHRFKRWTFYIIKNRFIGIGVNIGWIISFGIRITLLIWDFELERDRY